MAKAWQILSLSKPETKLWHWVFMALCLTYSFLFCNFIWGNHDWSAVIYGNALTDGMVEGRFSQYVLPNLLLMGQILPILNMLLGFACYALALTLLYSRFFDFKTDGLATIIIITAATLPYINEILYFRFIILSQLFWPLLITLSLLAAKNALSQSKPILWTFLSTLLLFTAIGGYPASINFYITAALLQITQQKDPVSVKKIFVATVPYLISFLSAFGFLYVFHFWLHQNHQMIDLYNNQPLTIKELILKIPFIYQATVSALIQPQPYFSLSLKLVMAIIILLFFVNEGIKKSSFYKFFLYLTLPLCLKFSSWLINENPEEYFAQHDPAASMLRTDFYAFPVLIMFCLAILTTAQNKMLKNISFLLGLFLCCQNCLSDINFSKVQTFGFKAEAMLQQRINNRIFEHASFDFKHDYKLTQTGEIALRQRYYTPQPFEKYGYYTLQIPYTRYWLPSEFYTFYEPENFIPTNEHISPEDITEAMSNFFLYKAKPWPSQDALYIDHNYIIIALTPEGRNSMRQQFNRLGISW